MASTEFWISSAAGGGGTGAIGDPFTLAEGVASTSRGTFYIEADGTYTTAVQLVIDTSYQHFIGANSSGAVDGSMPVIQASSTISGAMIDVTAANSVIVYVDADANDNADIGIDIGNSNCMAVSCIGRNGVLYGLYASAAGSTLSYCLAESNGSAIGIRVNQSCAYRCVSRGGLTGFRSNNMGAAIQCVAEGNTGDGFLTINTIDCTSENNTGDGFSWFCTHVNGLASNNGADGFNSPSNLLLNCAYGSGSEANTGGATIAQIDGRSIPTLVDAGTALFRDTSDTPVDYRLAASSALDGVGVFWAESMWGSTDTRPGIGIGDTEPATGGSSVPNLLSSTLIRS